MLQVWHLENSRSIRIVWLLEELALLGIKLPYKLHAFKRIGGLADPQYKLECKSKMGKAPVVWDGDLILTESGAITQFLVRKYAPSFTPKLEAEQAQVDEWCHFSEGTICTHAIAILYTKWHLGRTPHTPETLVGDVIAKLTPNVHNDLDAVETALEGGKQFLVGTSLTAADTMMAFSVDFIFTKNLGTTGVDLAKRWPLTFAWLQRLKQRPAWKVAHETTGDDLTRNV